MFESLRSKSYAVENGAPAEAQPSELARGGALLRALAAVEEREEIRGRDSLAEIFLGDNRRGSLNDPKIREWLIKNYIPHGVYGYSIARTAYFDHIMEQALSDNIPQIVILGAGYDSRPYRFGHLIRDTRIFELDDETTQQRKIKMLQQANIAVPDCLRFVPVTDEKDILRECLIKAGYDKNMQTLFVCEGITYYLSAKEVDEIFGFIKSDAPAGSTICFDYKRLSPGDGGIDDLKEIMGAGNNDESASDFGVEEGKIGIFLAERELMILEQLSANEMEKKYLMLGDGATAEKVASQYCIVFASHSG